MQRILIVEDDMDIQDILKNHLIDAGYEVVVAADGVAGIAMFDDTIDLVLLDIMLPKIDGYGVCEVIRRKSQVPIIMLTALSDEENQLRGYAGQIDDYIPNPFSPELLRVQIVEVTDLLTEKEISLEVDIPDKILCEADRTQMERAIQNVLVNAIRYSPNGEAIYISLSNEKDTVYCEVENTGVHIQEDMLDHLFEAFYRADTSRNRNTGGTGLGLYIVRKIMELHHAEYGIKNSCRGVVFWFEMPQKRSIGGSI